MRTLATLLVMSCTCMTAFGQWSVGPRASYGTITQSEAEIRVIPSSDEVPPQLTYNGGSSVKSVGFMLYNNLGPGFIQIEGLGTQFEQEYTSKPYTRANNEPQIHKETNYIFEVPVSAGVNIKENFKLGLGPVLEILMAKSSELKTIPRFIDTSKKANGGFQGLVGFTKGNLHVDVRYVYRFTSVVNDFTLGNDILKLNKSANRLSVAVGMMFGTSKKLAEPLEEDVILEF